MAVPFPQHSEKMKISNGAPPELSATGYRGVDYLRSSAAEDVTLQPAPMQALARVSFATRGCGCLFKIVRCSLQKDVRCGSNGKSLRQAYGFLVRRGNETFVDAQGPGKACGP